MPRKSTPFPESFLHFVWRMRYLHPHKPLYTCDGRKIDVIHPGYWNHDQGPDFLQAQLRIDGVLWHGHVEIHVQARDWYRHRHHHDPGYDGVVLHVVFQSKSIAVLRHDGTEIPELVLEGSIPDSLIKGFDHLQIDKHSIPCEKQFGDVPQTIKSFWLNRLAIERFETKTQQAQQQLDKAQGDWNQLLWIQLAEAMGGPINKEAFGAIARAVPYSTLNRYRQNQQSLEATLMGLAGMFYEKGNLEEPYLQMLHSTWAHLKRKHLFPEKPVFPLRYHRMRPASFPGIRLSQLAAILMQWPQPMALLNHDIIYQFLKAPIQASSFWSTHFTFSKSSADKPKHLGRQQKEMIILNTLIPTGLLYQKTHGQASHDTWLEKTLSQLQPEDNRYTRIFTTLDTPPNHVLDSQGMLVLYKQYCQSKRCLECGIGAHILGKKSRNHMAIVSQ
ncbi:MAG: DUF2851 family protein [Bacteroidia bacterium]